MDFQRVFFGLMAIELSNYLCFSAGRTVINTTTIDHSGLSPHSLTRYEKQPIMSAFHSMENMNVMSFFISLFNYRE